MSQAAPPPIPSRDTSESQWAIVGRMFAKRHTAVWGLRGTIALVLVAIYAPLISSGIPLFWRAPGGALESPWLRRLFDQNYWTNAVDRFFNLLLVAVTLWFVARGVVRVVVRHAAKRAVVQREVRNALLVLTLGLTMLQFQGGAWLRIVAPLVVWYGVARVIHYRVKDPDRCHDLETRARRGFLGLTALAVVLNVLGSTLFVPNADQPGGFLLTSEPYVDYRQVASAWEADEGTAVFTLIPYGHREQLPGTDDRYRGLLDFENGEVHVLGTDKVGRDVFARLLYGTRISLTVGLVAVAIYVLIGTILGAIAGYAGGRVDMLVMRVIEIVICVPGLFLILTIIALFGDRSIFMIMFAIGLVGWTGIARLVRGEMIRERGRDYVVAAQSMGLSRPRILFRHVLPNAIAPVIVAATFGVAGAIIVESTLSFLGLGDVSVPSWGMVLNEGRQDVEWHMILSPGVAIFITVTLLNLVGDGLRDALDPQLRH